MEAYKVPEKTTIVYTGNHDINCDGVTHVAIQTEAKPAYVFASYRNGILPETTLPSDMVIIPLANAKKLFRFEKVESLSRVKDSPLEQIIEAEKVIEIN